MIASTLGALTTAASVARGQPGGGAPQDVEAAEQAFSNLDYAEANRLADALSKRRALTHDQLVRATRVLALTHAVLDHGEAAKQAFIALVAYDPDYQIDPNLAPRVQQPYFEARGFWRGQATKPGLEATVSLGARERGTVRVTTRDPTHLVRRVQLGYRWGASGPFSVKSAPAAAIVSFDVPPPPRGVTRFDYFAHGLDDRDSVAFELGDAALPKSSVVVETLPSSVPSTRPTPATTDDSGGGSIFSSPYFWLAAGAVVLGGAATGYFATRKPGDERVPPTAGSLVPTYNCGAAACR